MKSLVERVVGLQHEAGLRRRVPAYPDGLTEREVEILRFVASGRSNHKIADKLFISQHTVVRHVSNIFSKIGSSNRAEAPRTSHPPQPRLVAPSYPSQHA